MEPKTISFRLLMIVSTTSVLFVIIFGCYIHSRQKGIIVFCNIGQGDGAYIRTKAREDIVIDAGPNSKILGCLSRHMPFYDRKIEAVFISHPQKDHYGGLEYILTRYKVDTIFVFGYIYYPQNLKKIIKDANVNVVQEYEGNSVHFMSGKIEVKWPPQEYVFKDDINELSQVLLFSDGSISVLFTGDIPGSVMSQVDTGHVDILKVPHHGSSDGLTYTLLKRIYPTLSVISVGKNSYGHPAPEVIKLLESTDSLYKRTDKGDIVERY